MSLVERLMDAVDGKAAAARVAGLEETAAILRRQRDAATAALRAVRDSAQPDGGGETVQISREALAAVRAALGEKT